MQELQIPPSSFVDAIAIDVPFVEEIFDTDKRNALTKCNSVPFIFLRQAREEILSNFMAQTTNGLSRATTAPCRNFKTNLTRKYVTIKIVLPVNTNYAS